MKDTLTSSIGQGNCHMCTIPKSLLDDIDTNYPARTKEGELRKVHDALFKGKWEGWEKGRKPSKTDGTIKPEPIVRKDGKIIQTRATRAARQLGRHLLPTFYDDLHNVDLHRSVCSSLPR